LSQIEVGYEETKIEHHPLRPRSRKQEMERERDKRSYRRFKSLDDPNESQK